MNKRQVKKRDGNIALHLKGNISLSIRVTKNRKLYTRKTKHKGLYND